MFQLLGVFAEFERSIIRERIAAGIARVRETGTTRSGRPHGRPKVPEKKLAAIRSAREEGVPIKKIARDLKCGVGTVYAALANTARQDSTHTGFDE